MKRILYTILLALASCVKSDIDVEMTPQTSNKSISFSNMSIDPASRAMVNKGNFADGEKVGIHAYYLRSGEVWDSEYSEPNFMYNQALTYYSEKQIWSYSPIKYWPSNSAEKIKFFAYYPYAETGSLVSINDETHTGSPTLSYAAPQECELQRDVMVAQTDALNNYDNSSKVNLSMDHALSQITFQAKLAEGAQEVKISGIKLRGVLNAGDLNMETLEWSNQSDATNEGYETSAKLKYEATTEEYRAILSTKPTTDLTADDGHLLMMPQKLEHAVVVVTFANVDDGGKITYNDIEYKMPSTTWESNTHYIYTIEFDSQEAKVTLKIAAAWIEATVPPISITGMAYDYTPTEVGRSNTYFIHPMPVKQTIYIPIDRIDMFWGNQGYENNPAFMIKAGKMKSEVIWGRQFDKDEKDNGETQLSNLSDNERKAILRQNDYTGITHEVVEMPSGSYAIKLSVPKDCPEGNMLIGVYNPDNDVNGAAANGKAAYDKHRYSWSWHFWITNYNPDQTVIDNMADIEHGDGSNSWSSLSRSQDKVIRIAPKDHANHNPDYIWSSGHSYDGKVMMDRNIGAGENNVKSALIYQFGRKDPIRPLLYQSNRFIKWGTNRPNAYYYINCKDEEDRYNHVNGEQFAASSMGESVNDPVLLFGRSSSLSLWLEPTKAGNYKYNKDGIVWQDPFKRSETNDFDNIERKSIFDPSPLGWMVPNLAAFEYLEDQKEAVQPGTTGGLTIKDYNVGTTCNIIYNTGSGTPATATFKSPQVFTGLLYEGLIFRANYYLESTSAVAPQDINNQFNYEFHLSSNAPAGDSDDINTTETSQIYTISASKDGNGGAGGNGIIAYDPQYRVDCNMIRCVQE